MKRLGKIEKIHDENTLLQCSLIKHTFQSQYVFWDLVPIYYLIRLIHVMVVYVALRHQRHLVDGWLCFDYDLGIPSRKIFMISYI